MTIIAVKRGVSSVANWASSEEVRGIRLYENIGKMACARAK